MKKAYELLVKVSDAIFFVEKYLLLAAVIVAVVVNFANVVMRYLLNAGLSYCEMLSIVLFMFMVVIGANIAVKTNDEIKIDVFKFKNPKSEAKFRLIADVVVLIALVCTIKGLADTVQSVMVYPQKVTPLPIYTYHIYIVMVIGFAMILLDRIIIFLKHILVASGVEVEGGAKTI